MKTNHLTRRITLVLDEKETGKLEGFIEQICDDHHIYDAYYGNILAANAIAFELLQDLCGKKQQQIDIQYDMSREGLRFSLHIAACFLDFACLYDKVRELDPHTPEAYEEDIRPMMMIRMLSDDIELNPEKEMFTLHFRITGINELLSIQRIELLEKYYANVRKLQKA